MTSLLQETGWVALTERILRIPLLVWLCLCASPLILLSITLLLRACSLLQRSSSKHTTSTADTTHASTLQPTPQPDQASTAPHTPVRAEGKRRADPHDPSPRAGYLEWDDYFMALAFLSAQRSKDPSKQVGAVIVGPNRVVLGIGYNGFPRGCSDKSLPWCKKAASKDPLDTKYPYVVHAEANALLNKNSASVEGATVYVTMFPCNECAKLLIQAGVAEVVYNEGKVHQHDSCGAEIESPRGCQKGSTAQHSTAHEVQAGCSVRAALQPSSPAAGKRCSKLVSDKDRSRSGAVGARLSGSNQGGGVSEEGEGCILSCSSPVQLKSGAMRSDAGRQTAEKEVSVLEASYRASLKLLTLAGVGLRQHCLERTVVLSGSMQ